MASFGANFTSTEDAELPSIFEVLAQESLVASLKPAMQHFFRVLAENNPSRYGRLYALSDEVYAFMDLILENYYLQNYSSSFSENFYGMKRVATSPENDKGGEKAEEEGKASTNTTRGLPPSQHLRSLLFLVLVPYLKSKCDEMYERLHEQAQYEDTTDQRENKGFKHKLTKAFLGSYPILHTIWEGAIFSFTLAYIFGKSKYHSPLISMAGVTLENLTEDDMEEQAVGSSKQPFSLKNKNMIQRLFLVTNKALGAVALTLSTGLSVGVFFLQFLEWWYASDQHATSLTALPTPPPPKTEDSDVCKVPPTVCPLCQKIRSNDTVLANTGYVFCYSCIYTYVSENSSCPVTGYPTDTENLVKLYLEDS